MPGDPRINEQGCLFMLQQPVNLETLPYLQNAALQVVVDLYDRKVTREEFMKSAGDAITLYAMLAKLYVTAQTSDLHDKGTLTSDTIQTYADKLVLQASGRMAALAKMMTLLVQCPTSDDVVH